MLDITNIPSGFFNLKDPETRKKMKEEAPAIFASTPCVKMSDKYNFINTIKIAEELQEMGLLLRKYGQQKSSKRPPRTQEHIMRFTMPEAFADEWNVGDSVPELVIVNSHNGYQTLRCYAGIFRMVCSNGMVISEQQFGNYRQKHIHIDNPQEYALENVKIVAEKIRIIGRRVKFMEETILDRHKQTILAKNLIRTRKTPDWVEPQDVLQHIRDEDAPLDGEGNRSLWKTFNVVQENLTSNNVVKQVGETNRTRRLRTISGAISDFRVNGKMWSVMEDFIADDDHMNIPTTQELLAA